MKSIKRGLAVLIVALCVAVVGTTTRVSGDPNGYRYEAEAYSTMYGIGTEGCSEGTENIGWIDANDWADYAINVPDGNYRLLVRYAGTGNGTIALQQGNSTKATVGMPATGGWQTWTSIESESFTITGGAQSIRLFFQTGGFNLNYFELVSAGGTTNNTTPETGGKLVVLGATSSAVLGGNVATNAIDNNTNSRWESEYVDNANITLDLGSTKSVNKVVLNWEGAFGRAYDIQVSTNGTNYQTVYTQNNGAGGNETLTFNATDARYVRLQGVSRGTIWGYSLWEMEVHGGSGSGATNPGTTNPETPSNPGTTEGKLAIASASSSTVMGTNVAGNAIDNDTNSRWESAFVDNANITFDLGSTKSINKVVLNWEGAYGKAYYIQVSTDGSNYQTVYTQNNGNGGIETITFNAVNARYVRLQGITRGTGWGYSLWEAEIHGGTGSGTTDPGTTNPENPSNPGTTEGKLAIASATSSTVIGTNVAGNAVDNNTNSRWESAFADNASITLDLGSTKSVNKVVLNWEGAYGKAYYIQVSTNGSNYQTVYTKNNGTGGIETLTFNAVDARYVRLQGIARGTAWGYSLWEMEVYGASANGGTTGPTTPIETIIDQDAGKPQHVENINLQANQNYVVSFSLNLQNSGRVTIVIGNSDCEFVRETVEWNQTEEVYFTYFLSPKASYSAQVKVVTEQSSYGNASYNFGNFTYFGLTTNGSYQYLKPRQERTVIYPQATGNNSSIVRRSYKGAAIEILAFERQGDGSTVIRNVMTNRVLGVENGSTSDSARVLLVDYTGDASQKWYINDAENNGTRIVNMKSGKTLDYSVSSGSSLVQKNVSGSATQLWDVVDVDMKNVFGKKVASDVASDANWDDNVIIYPQAGALVPAGTITIALSNSRQNVFTKYEIFINNQLVGTVNETNSAVLTFDYYSTTVRSNDLRIKGYKQDGSTIDSQTTKFYVSKKGIGSGTLCQVDDMNLSWYYDWSTVPPFGTDLAYDYVPMIWNDNAGGRAWLSSVRNQRYKQVLAYNEPDLTDQSNMSVNQVVSLWGGFTNSGLRVGSVATGIFAGWSPNWFGAYMDGINNNVDFIAVHFYTESMDADWYVSQLDALYAKYHKPIWITEFANAHWNNGTGITDAAAVRTFMAKVLPLLDSRDYIERYAWFPFDPLGGNSGSALYSHQTGELNELGRLYRSLGLPSDYVA